MRFPFRGVQGEYRADRDVGDHSYDAASGPDNVPDLFGLGDDTYVSGTGVGSSIWLRQRKPSETGLYLGIVCDTNEAVDAYAAAINAGGIDEGGPADRTYFAPRARSVPNQPLVARPRTPPGR